MEYRKSRFYDDFIENIANTPWEMEIYKRQMSLAASIGLTHSEPQQTNLVPDQNQERTDALC